MTIIQPDRLNIAILMKLANLDAKELHDFFIVENDNGHARTYLTYPAALRIQQRAWWWLRYTTRESDPLRAEELRRMVVGTLIGWGPWALVDFVRIFLNTKISVGAAEWHLKWCANALAFWKHRYWAVNREVA